MPGRSEARIIFVFRFQTIADPLALMADQEDSTSANGTNDGKLNPEDSVPERLLAWTQLGFNTVVDKLDEMPLKTAEAMAELIQPAEGRVFLETKARELQVERDQLVERMSCQAAHIQNQKAKIEQLTKEVNDKTREIVRLQRKEVQLREMVIGSAGAQEVTESEIIGMFSDLRQNVQQLASSSVFDLTTIPSPHSIDARSQQTRHFYAVCDKLKPRDIANRLRAEIFYIIHVMILNQTYFGLKRDAEDVKSTSKLWETEDWLTHFEVQLLSLSGG